MIRFNKILVPTDFSKDQRALMLQRRNWLIHLVEKLIFFT